MLWYRIKFCYFIKTLDLILDNSFLLINMMNMCVILLGIFVFDNIDRIYK